MSSENLQTLTTKQVKKFTLEDRSFDAKIVQIYDADTCHAIFFLDNQFVKFNCRLFGIDTPEMKPPKNKPNRLEEKKMAKRARNRLVQLATNCDCNLDTMYKKKEIQSIIDKNTKIVKLHCHHFDKYGRLLAEFTDINDNKTYNQKLIDEKFAYVYNGGTKKKF